VPLSRLVKKTRNAGRGIATYSLEVVFHLTQLRHNCHGLGFACLFLNLGVLNSHKHIVFLLISNGELASGNFVVLSKRVQALHSLALRNRCGKLDVDLGVFVSRIDNSVIGQRCKAFVQSLVHLLGITLEESSTSSDEQSIASKNSPVVSILHKEADAVLSVAWRVHTFESDVTQLEGLAVTRRLGHALAVFAADDIQLGGTEFGKLGRLVNARRCHVVVKEVYQLLVASSMIPMVMCVDNSCQVDLARLNGILQNRCNLWRVGRINDDSILRLVVNYQVGVVVGASLPHRNRLDMHGARCNKSS
jgi:hypothetical protein